MANVLLSSSVSNDAKEVFVLHHSSWNDWWRFETLYRLEYIDEEGNQTLIGTVKIGNDAESKTPELNNSFNSLPSNFFSLGQDTEYYRNLSNLGEEIQKDFLLTLNDLAYDLKKLKEKSKLSIVTSSLLRDVSIIQVTSEFSRLAQGKVEPTEYNITYTSYSQSPILNPPIKLEFNVNPKSEPPSNVHVVIGRNGVGKTHLLNNMINSLLRDNSRVRKFGLFTNENNDETLSFRHLVSVNFSAFDNSLINKDRRPKSNKIGYNYIGLKRSDDSSGDIKSSTQLKNEFVKAIEICSRGAKYERWRNALKELETDNVFKEADITSITQLKTPDEVRESADYLFKKLSSGHTIILLSITRLVALIEERTLVLLDEPETHLHPPLLSAYIRSLSGLLSNRNAVALIATHSPVVLQEVSNLCAYKLFRQGNISTIKRIDKNTFGENVSVLTHDVFGLEVTDSGFYNLIKKAVELFDDFDEINDFFNNSLGSEAQAHVRQLLYLKTKNLRRA